MRRLFIAGNWKMNMKLDSAKALAKGLKNEAARVDEVDIAVCPPYLYVPAVAEILNGSNIGYGAQNVYFEKAGAFTGEIETAMLADFGCRYVILGHSERRHIMGESSELVNKGPCRTGRRPDPDRLRRRAPFRTGSGCHEPLNRRQFDGSLSGVSADDMKKCVIAYEPVWAIGTGKVATPNRLRKSTPICVP